jgi:hypothetical protein
LIKGGHTVTRSRRFDGKPETDADRRFFDLRSKGHTGPIDQDGYPVTDSKILNTFAALDRLTERAIKRGQK